MIRPLRATNHLDAGLISREEWEAGIRLFNAEVQMWLTSRRAIVRGAASRVKTTTSALPTLWAVRGK